MTKSNNPYFFHRDKLVKVWRNGQPCPSVTYDTFPKDNELRVADVLDEYIKRTSTVTENQNTSQLFLRTISPHKAVISSTISCCVKNVFSMAGSNTDIFKAHSTRSAATSSAKSFGKIGPRHLPDKDFKIRK